MITRIFKSFAGSHYRKYIKKVTPVVRAINKIEEGYQSLADEALRAKTEEFRRRYREGETLDELLPEAFATVKNTSRRLLGRKITVCGHELRWDMVHFDVQLIGGIALHDSKIAEMATGEGKTVVATLPLYLNAIAGKNCQLVTVNDYLARRDSEWMGYIYEFLGLTVGCIQNQMEPAERREQYGCDITYGTASEFGFDYLRDNGMATRKEDQVQRDHFFCIVDEVDSVLIDEARTPLIISGPAQVDREMPFQKLKPGIAQLVRQQNALCNRLVSDAREELRKEEADEFSVYRKLLQVKLGMPKNKQFLHMMEDGAIRKPFDRYELEMGGDLNKSQYFAMKEELYFVIDEKGHQADLTEQGRRFLSPDDEDAFVLPDLPSTYMEIDRDSKLDGAAKQKAKAKAQGQFEERSEAIHSTSQLLRAYSLYERDVEYIVKEGKVMIIDENTGRTMPGRRWSDGLHQAIEAKEGVIIEKESKTYATITIQNYFRMYEKLAGMTGTAETEANEFRDIYGLSVMVIPTNKPMIREDADDLIYKTRREKYNAVINEIRKANSRGQPVLVGTVSVEASEVLSRMLKRATVGHSVLNAKFHAQEAEIVARAGQRGSVTIATNMAGRGTDIKLGREIADRGGLYVIGTERHTARRIDRQLRGRSGRQGDPGASLFFISLEDDLLRLFGNAGAVGKLLEKSVGEGEMPLPTWVIENAQKRVEEQNYSIRKRLLQYDDVLNRQREIIYNYRNDAIHSENPREIAFELIRDELEARMEDYGMLGGKTESRESQDVFLHWVNTHLPIVLRGEDFAGMEGEKITDLVLEKISAAYATKEAVENPEALRALERYLVIHNIDKHWQGHLTEMEDLRQSVGLRGYGQKDPLREYQNEGFIFFEEMMKNIRSDICMSLFRSATNVRAFENMLSLLSRNARSEGPQDGDSSLLPRLENRNEAGAGKLPQVTVRRRGPKVGRNHPCPCGSGRKYKRCCGRF